MSVNPRFKRTRRGVEAPTEPLSEINQPCSDSTSGEDDELILRSEQLGRLEYARRRLLSCRTDDDRFDACADIRDEILAEVAAYRYFVGRIESTMYKTCTEYRRRKLYGWSVEDSENDDEERWEQFVDAAEE